jgi:hypothetical protein
VPKPGQKTITLSGKLLRSLEEKYEKEKTERPSLSFSAFIAESALIELERRNILREAQFISLIDLHDNVVILKDGRKTKKFVEVQIKGNKLKCLTDDRFDCIHVGFALALPEVRKALSR